MFQKKTCVAAHKVHNVTGNNNKKTNTTYL